MEDRTRITRPQRLTPPGFVDGMVGLAYGRDGTALAVWSRRKVVSGGPGRSGVFVSNDQEVLLAARSPGADAWDAPRQVSTTAPIHVPALLDVGGQILVVYGEDPPIADFPFARVLAYAVPLDGGEPTEQVIAPRIRNPGPVRLEALDGGRVMALWPDDQGLGIATRSSAGDWTAPMSFARGIDLFGATDFQVDVRGDGRVVAVGEPDVASRRVSVYAFELTPAGRALPRTTLCRRCVGRGLAASGDEVSAFWITEQKPPKGEFRIEGAVLK